MSSQASSGGCPRSRYHEKDVLPSVTAGATNTSPETALRQDRSACSARSRKPSSKVMATVRRERLARVEQLDRGQDVDDAVSLGGEVVHLLGEGGGRDGELVAIFGNAVVEKDRSPLVSRRPRVRISQAAERARVPPALAR